jgi:hypothetical protein
MGRPSSKITTNNTANSSRPMFHDEYELENAFLKSWTEQRQENSA